METVDRSSYAIVIVEGMTRNEGVIYRGNFEPTPGRSCGDGILPQMSERSVEPVAAVTVVVWWLTAAL